MLLCKPTKTKTQTALLLAKPTLLNINLGSGRFVMFNKKRDISFYDGISEVSEVMQSNQNDSTVNHKLSLIIVTYNSASVLPALLDSLSAGLEGVEKCETIVVDNDSVDASASIAVAHPARPRVIRMGRNAGYAAAINAAAATVQPFSDLLILNPDVRLRPGAAKLLVQRLTDSRVGVAVPRMFAEDGATQWSLRREPSLLTAWAEALLGGTFAGRIGIGEMIAAPDAYKIARSVDWACGAVLAIAARARTAVGNWDESFFLYMEEVEYLRRVRQCGFSVSYVPDAEVIHIGGEYKQNARLSALLAANRIRYHRRYHGRLSTGLFRLSMILGEGLRAAAGGPPGHAASMRAALTRRGQV